MSNKKNHKEVGVVTNLDWEEIEEGFLVVRSEDIDINLYKLMEVVKDILDGKSDEIEINDINLNNEKYKKIFVARPYYRTKAIIKSIQNNSKIFEELSGIDVKEEDYYESCLSSIEDNYNEDYVDKKEIDNKKIVDFQEIMTGGSLNKKEKFKVPNENRGLKVYYRLNPEDILFTHKKVNQFINTETPYGKKFIKSIIKGDVFSNKKIFCIKKKEHINLLGFINEKENTVLGIEHGTKNVFNRYLKVDRIIHPYTIAHTSCPLVLLVNAEPRVNNPYPGTYESGKIKFAILFDAFIAQESYNKSILSLKNPRFIDSHIEIPFFSKFNLDSNSNIYINFIDDMEKYHIDDKIYEKITKEMIKITKIINKVPDNSFLASIYKSKIFKSNYYFGKLDLLCNIFTYLSSFNNPFSYEFLTNISNIKETLNRADENGIMSYFDKEYKNYTDGKQVDTFYRKAKNTLNISKFKKEIKEKFNIKDKDDEDNNVINEDEDISNSNEVLEKYIPNFSTSDFKRDGHDDRRERIRNTVRSIPFGRFSKVSYNIKKIKEDLNEKVYGLDSVKEHIIDYLAVMARNPDLSPPVICLAGPPGIGKTTICKIIAESINRKFDIISCSGMSESFSLIGSHNSYAYAREGEIIRSLIQSKVMNPLVLLDEVDKAGTSHHNGNVQDTLVSILDPVQNNKFKDKFINVEVDISKIQFITTVNDLDILSPPLRNRMSIIELPGYNEDEKIIIMKKSIIPEIFKEYKIKEGEVTITENAIRQLIEQHGNEPGIREVKRIARNIFARVVNILESGEQTIKIDDINKFTYVGSENKHGIGFN